jgi:hypothetical protein
MRYDPDFLLRLVGASDLLGGKAALARGWASGIGSGLA